jgi:signal peptidase
MRSVVNWLANILLVLVILTFAFLLVVSNFLSGRAAIVLSGSMEPVLPRGALAFTMAVDPAEVKVGDIITYDFDDDPKLTTSHRVVEILTEDGQIAFRTKGDANEDIDPQTVRVENLRGRVFFHIPYVGRWSRMALSYLQGWPGLVIFVAIPTALILTSSVTGLMRGRNPRQRHLQVIERRRRQWKAFTR